jgi:hypothetical protein
VAVLFPDGFEPGDRLVITWEKGTIAQPTSTPSSTTTPARIPTPNNPIAVEYRIVPMSNAFTKITYNNSLGAAIVITDSSQFPNGSKTISVTAIPFTAEITTEINNTTPDPINCNLAILVDGQVKKLVGGSAPPITSLTVTSAEFIVQ